MKVIFRIERALLARIHTDLSRPHAFAHERVGFISCRVGQLEGGFVLLADHYDPVADEDYEDGHEVGAMMGSAAIRKALQAAYRDRLSMVHVHRHEHTGVPRFSRIDLSEGAKFIPDFWKVRPELPHGMIVLSQDALTGVAWDPVSKQRFPIQEAASIGRPMSIWRIKHVSAPAAAELPRRG